MLKVYCVKGIGMSGGIVYCITNDEINFKIGKTSKSAEERSKEIGRSSLCEPFRVKFFIRIGDRHKAEKDAHEILKDYRIRKDREFFKAPLDEIKRVFDILEKRYHVKLEDVEEERCQLLSKLAKMHKIWKNQFDTLTSSSEYILSKRRLCELEKQIDIFVYGSETTTTKMYREFWNNKEMCQDPENEVNKFNIFFKGK